jgi:hypothetical protein
MIWEKGDGWEARLRGRKVCLMFKGAGGGQSKLVIEQLQGGSNAKDRVVWKAGAPAVRRAFERSWMGSRVT